MFACARVFVGAYESLHRLFLLVCASALVFSFWLAWCLVESLSLPSRFSFGLGQVGAFGVLESVPFLRWAVRGAVCGRAKYIAKTDSTGAVVWLRVSVA